MKFESKMPIPKETVSPPPGIFPYNRVATKHLTSQATCRATKVCIPGDVCLSVRSVEKRLRWKDHSRDIDGMNILTIPTVGLFVMSMMIGILIGRVGNSNTCVHRFFYKNKIHFRA